MKTNFQKHFCFILLFSVTFSSFAQLWNPVSAAKLDLENPDKEFRKTEPNTYQLFSLDASQLKAEFDKAPSRTTQKSSNVIIELPLENGSLERFRVLEAQILDNELSAKYPEIKSYVAYGIDDPTATARLSFSTLGLHAMITSGNHGTRYIDPYTKDKNYYISYASKDLPADVSDFTCMVEDDAIKSVEIDENSPNKNADDGILRTFRLAVVTTGEYSRFHLNNQNIPAGASDQRKKEAVLSAINITMTRVNGVFETDLALTMVLVNNNEDIIFLDPATDNLTNNNSSALLGECQRTCDNIIGFNNYDIGHVFSTGGGGVASLRSPCTNGKARGVTGRFAPIGDPYDIDYVAHEMGHQYGANHTQNNSCQRSSRSVEPGSASTIMGYAGICSPNVQNNSDAYFHAISIQEMWANISTGSGRCAAQSNTGNSAPSADAGSDHTIPASTPFVLRGNGTDSDSGDALTYCWEQMDPEPATMPPSPNSTRGPAFRSLDPKASPDRYMPDLSTVQLGRTASTWEVIPGVSRTMNFRLTVRDNAPGGGGSASDNMRITVAGNAGPFVVNSPNTNVNWDAGSTQTVTWDVAGTTGNGINASNVDILLSTDGGDTFPITIVSGVTNDGSQSITVPNVEGDENRIMVRGSGNIFFDISNANFRITGGTGTDTEAPTVPDNVTSSNVTSSSVVLSWDASSDNVGVTGYDISNGDDNIIATVQETSYTVTGLDSETDYEFQVRAKDAAGNTSDFSNVVNVTTLPGSGGGDSCDNAVSSFPYAESFENTLGAWTQSDDDDFNWTVDSNGTPSRSTGPSDAADDDFYVYMESSTPNYPNRRAILNSPCFDLSNVTIASFNFQYHMYGSSNMGSLALEISDDNGSSWTSLWSESGNQGNSWNPESVSLANYVGSVVQLRFNGVTGTTWQGDMAVDAVELVSSDTSGCTNIELVLNFDNYPEEVSWDISNSDNEIVASGDNYADQPDLSSIQIEECLDNGTYTLTVRDSYGDGLCCRYGEGSYSLETENGTVLASGDEYGFTEATTFTINGSARNSEDVISIDKVVSTDQIDFGIFPNPVAANGNLYIKAPGSDVQYTIYNMLGKVMNEDSMKDNTIAINGLPQGLYIIKFVINEKPIIKKFTVK